MEYHLVNILILLFLLTCTHRAKCSTEITNDENAHRLKMVWQLDEPWQKLSKKGPSQMLW